MLTGDTEVKVCQSHPLPPGVKSDTEFVLTVKPGAGLPPQVAGRQLAITTSSRFWDLVAIDGEDQAQEWARLIQEKAIGDADSMEIDLLPGHGDFMFKRGKGMAKFADDKQR